MLSTREWMKKILSSSGKQERAGVTSFFRQNRLFAKNCTEGKKGYYIKGSIYEEAITI